MTEYITKEQALEAVLSTVELKGEEWVEFWNKIKKIPAADVIERPEMFARLMNEFNVVDIDEDDGECTLNDQWVSIIDVLDTIDGMRAEGAESIWGNDARTGGDSDA